MANGIYDNYRNKDGFGGEKLKAAKRPPQAELILLVVLAVMVVTLVFLLPSGGFLAGSAAEYRKDFETDYDTAVYNLKSDILTAAGLDTLSKLYYVPWDSKAAAPNPEGFTETETTCSGSFEEVDHGYSMIDYSDETITVHYWRERHLLNGYNPCTVHFAEITISHPTQLRTAFAGGEYHDKASRAEEFPQQMAQDVNAVVAVNGDYYNYRDTGVLIRNNVGYRFKPYGKASWDVLLIDDEGNFHIQSDRKLDLEKLEKEKVYTDANGVDYSIVNTIHFGPSLVVDGQYKIISENSGCGSEFNFEEGRSRTAIGQLGKLHYLLCVVEDTAEKPNSFGAKVDMLGKLMLEKGCIQAYNLDGGQSSVMILNNEVLNHIYRGDARKLTDIVYFASAMPEQ